MTKNSFESVLDVPASDIERPKPLPVGSYLCLVQGQPRIDKSRKKQTEFSEFTLKMLQALDDVDLEALEGCLTSPSGDKKLLQDCTIKVTFYHTENSIYRLKEFLEHCGVEIKKGMSLRQLIAETPGCEVIAHLSHEASEDGEAIYARVRSTEPVE